MMTALASKAFKSKLKEVELPQSWEPSPKDIICARGKVAAEHIGNILLKEQVKFHLSMYAASRCKFQKSKIVSQIVESVRQGSPDGGFVKFADDGWVRVSDRHAREKVGQLFRDLLHNQYKSSTKAKAKSRRTSSGKTSCVDDETSSHSSNNSCSSSCDYDGQSLTGSSGKIASWPSAVQPLPAMPPSMIRVESFSSLIGQSFAGSQTTPTATATWKSHQSLSSSQFQGKTMDSLPDLPAWNPLRLPNFEPVPIDEAAIDNLFDIQNSDPVPVIDQAAMDNLFDLPFGSNETQNS